MPHSIYTCVFVIALHFWRAYIGWPKALQKHSAMQKSHAETGCVNALFKKCLKYIHYKNHSYLDFFSPWDKEKHEWVQFSGTNCSLGDVCECNQFLFLMMLKKKKVSKHISTFCTWLERPRIRPSLNKTKVVFLFFCKHLQLFTA